MSHKTITADGLTTLIEENKAHSVTVYFSGAFGGGTLTLGYESAVGTFEGFADSSGVIIYTSPNQAYIVGLGIGTKVIADLQGSTAASLIVETRNVI